MPFPACCWYDPLSACACIYLSHLLCWRYRYCGYSCCLRWVAVAALRELGDLLATACYRLTGLLSAGQYGWAVTTCCLLPTKIPTAASPWGLITLRPLVMIHTNSCCSSRFASFCFLAQQDLAWQGPSSGPCWRLPAAAVNW